MSLSFDDSLEEGEIHNSHLPPIENKIESVGMKTKLAQNKAKAPKKKGKGKYKKNKGRLKKQKTEEGVKVYKSKKRNKRQAPKAPKKEICKFYLDNRCTFENCRFSHDLKTLPCKFYHVLGWCRHNETCR
jgi:hypothetical protein